LVQPKSVTVSFDHRAEQKQDNWVSFAGFDIMPPISNRQSGTVSLIVPFVPNQLTGLRVFIKMIQERPERVPNITPSS